MHLAHAALQSQQGLPRRGRDGGSVAWVCPAHGSCAPVRLGRGPVTHSRRASHNGMYLSRPPPWRHSCDRQ
ncbi:hypothetical protein FM125_09930 [Micrococcus lylae]|uniref:Uncharacterized protein n=1 Tax=Micrococcus lylae TaxID=1273 RepID=A0A1R4JQ34_9MICC|nr:hypothetical protein FM125_09930 [Micrococcus lylae]